MNIDNLKSKATSLFGGAKEVAVSSKEYYMQKIKFVDELLKKDDSDIFIDDVKIELNKLRSLKKKMADAKSSTKALFKKNESEELCKEIKE